MKKRAPIRARVEAFAAQAYLALMFIDQNDQDGFNGVMTEMQEALDEDKKLAHHLHPGLSKLCREKNLELHGQHVRPKEKH